MTLSVAESVTSGCLQLLFSNAHNAQGFYQGGITTYNGAQKTMHLHVEPIYAAHCNCVSQKTALEMAHGVCALFYSDIGIAVTGYATPVPEEHIEDIYAFIAIVHKNKVLYKGKITPAQKEMKGLAAQQDYAAQIIKRVASLLNK